MEALGELEADELGEVDELGETDRLAELEGEPLALGDTELLGLVELDGEVLAEGEAEAEGEVIAPAFRATTEALEVIGFHRQTKRIRPDVIVPVETVIIISRLIARTGKFVAVLAIKVAWGVAPYQIS